MLPSKWQCGGFIRGSFVGVGGGLPNGSEGRDIVSKYMARFSVIYVIHEELYNICRII